MRGLYGEEKRRMEMIDLILKIGCLFLISMASVVFIVMAFWMINEMKK